MSGASMPQYMGAEMRQGHAQRVEAVTDDSSEPIGGQGTERCYHSKEYLLPIGLGPYLTQVAEDGVADRTAQRVGAWPLGFAVRNGQNLTLPIEVLQTQCRDFTGSKAVHSQQHQQSVITNINGLPSFGSGE